MVHQKKCNHSCRAPTRAREYPCRLAEPTHYRFQRLKITQEDFRNSGQETGSLLNRFVEARSRSIGCGCSVSSCRSHLPYMFSFIYIDPSLLDQASQRKNISSNYSSCVAQSNLVPTITKQSGGHLNPLTTNPRYCDKSHGTESPITNPSHMASFRRSAHAGRLSERVVDLLQKSWRHLTESAYSNAWRQWDS